MHNNNTWEQQQNNGGSTNEQQQQLHHTADQTQQQQNIDRITDINITMKPSQEEHQWYHSREMVRSQPNAEE